MRDKLSDYQEEYGDLYNLEATPAESTSYRLAKHDKEKYPDIITASDNAEVPYYTNSSHLPVGYTDDMFSALDIQDDLQTLYTSGTVFHAFLGERLKDWKSAAKLVKTIADNYKLPYYTISPTYSVCRNHGYLVGEQFKCPTCGEETEVYSRITGYYRPVKNWNVGKSQEYKMRKTYKVDGESKKSTTKSTKKVQKQILLFATPTCPNCKMAATLLTKANIPFEKINAEVNAEQCKEYGIKQAPTLLIINGDNVEKIVNVSNIKKFAEENSVKC